MRTPIHKYTAAQHQFLVDNIKGKSRKEITQLFNDHFNTQLKVTQLTAYLKRNKISSGRDGRFVKGQKSWNKGMKGLQLGGEKGWFKKGCKPHNYQPIGTERVNTEGYVDIKIADPNKWKAKHRIIWEEANGPVPKDHVVIFADRNRHNFDLENLFLISRRQLSFLNKYGLIQNDIESTKTGILIADIHGKIGEMKRKK